MSPPARRRRIRGPIRAILLAALACIAGRAAGQTVDPPPAEPAAPAKLARPGDPPESEGKTVRRLSIEADDIFSAEEHRRHLFYRLSDALHVTTRDHVIAREVLLIPGAPFDPDLAEQTERNLRALPFLAEARVESSTADGGGVDVRVRTRDRLTLRTEVGGGLSGGVLSRRFSLGESNFLGLGKKFRVSQETEGRVTVRSAKYEDYQLLGSRLHFEAAMERSDRGRLSSFGVDLPERSRDQAFSWGLRRTSQTRETVLYRAGKAVARVPTRSDKHDLTLKYAWGPWATRHSLQLNLGDVRNRRDPIPGFGDLGSSSERTAILAFASDTFGSYERRRDLDGLGYIEDVPIGRLWLVGTGYTRKHGTFRGTEHPIPVLASILASRPTRRGLFTAGLSANTSLADPKGRTWGASAFLHAYDQFLPLHTLAASIALDAAGTRDSVPLQFTLGEDSGLRGYPARRFEGSRRLRLNFELRRRLARETLTVRSGLVLFADAGAAWNPHETLPPLRSSAGLGVRMASLPYVGRQVVRIDLAFPINRLPGDPSWSVSVSTGQVFGLFDNPELLDQDF